MIAGIEVPVGGQTDPAHPARALAAWRMTEAPADAPTVIAIHGITSTSRSWLAVAAALGERVGLVAPDLRGRAASRALGPPFGLDAHAADVVALLDHLGLERAVIAGHSLGAYVACRVATAHPDRVSRLVLVDGGLPLPALDAAPDPHVAITAALGPVVARLGSEFPDRAAYRAWWAAHPAFTGSDIADEVRDAVADYELGGEPPRLRSSIRPEVVPADGVDLVGVGDAARLAVEAVLLHAPRGLDGAEPPMLDPRLVEEWAVADPARRRAVFVPDANHYTILMGAAGARLVAAEIAAAVDPLDSGPAIA